MEDDKKFILTWWEKLEKSDVSTRHIKEFNTRHTAIDMLYSLMARDIHPSAINFYEACEKHILVTVAD